MNNVHRIKGNDFHLSVNIETMVMLANAPVATVSEVMWIYMVQDWGSGAATAQSV
jgi:hypothetical protein